MAKILVKSHAFDHSVGHSYSLKLCNQKIGIIQLGHLATHKKGHSEGPALSMVYPSIHHEDVDSINFIIKTLTSQLTAIGIAYPCKNLNSLLGSDQSVGFYPSGKLVFEGKE